MQPNIIENFVNFSTCKTINDYFDNNVKLNKEGYSNIEVSRLLPYYDGFHLLNLLNKNNSDEALLYDLLNMMIQSVAFQFNFSKNEYQKNITFTGIHRCFGNLYSLSAGK